MTAPRTELRKMLVEQLTGLTCEHGEGIYPCPACTADAVLGLWDVVIYSVALQRIVAYTHPKEPSDG